MDHGGTNDLVITGPPALLRNVRAALAGEDTAFDFARVLPPPRNLAEGARESWCIEHWGTTTTTGGDPALVDDSTDAGSLSYGFTTPGGAPLALVAHLAAQHPQLEITLIYEAARARTVRRYCWSAGLQTSFAYFDDLARMRRCGERRSASQPAKPPRPRRAPNPPGYSSRCRAADPLAIPNGRLGFTGTRPRCHRRTRVGALRSALGRSSVENASSTRRTSTLAQVPGDSGSTSRADVAPGPLGCPICRAPSDEWALPSAGSLASATLLRRMGNRKLNVSLRTNVVSGVIAALIWAIISAVTGAGLGTVIVGGVILGVITFVISFLISRLIIQAQRGRKPH